MTQDNLYNEVKQILLDNIDGMTKEEATRYVENDMVCINGSVSSLIYYDDTTAFYDRHEEEILELAKEYLFEQSPVELGGLKYYKNNMAWFAFEETARKVFEDMKERGELC